MSSNTILLDTGVLYALGDRKDAHNLDAKAIMLRCLKGDFGSPFVVDYVMLETLTLFQQRGISSVIDEMLKFIRLNKIAILFMNEVNFNEATKLMLEETKEILSLADSSQIVVSKEMRIGTIATFDQTLANFFDKSIGKGYYELLNEKEKGHLLKSTRNL